MNKQKIGRNDPCPCGSGKKYKKCCFLFSDSQKVPENHYISSSENIDYGIPMPTDLFFKLNKVRPYSAPFILFNLLHIPKSDKLALEIAKKYTRRAKEDEESRIIKSNGPENLFKIAVNTKDNINQLLLVDKLLEYKDKTIPLIVNELKTTSDDLFIDLAIKTLYKSQIDYSNELIDIIFHFQKNCYVISQLCMLLGFYNNKIILKTLWDYYHYFKINYPDETYSDGPLLGLINNKGKKIEI